MRRFTSLAVLALGLAAVLVAGRSESGARQATPEPAVTGGLGVE